MRVVVLGGYGNFGARICRALFGDPAIELIVAGRSIEQANAFACHLPLPARAAAIDIDRDDLAAQISALNVQLVIHTAGPFQSQDYRVAMAAARAKAHYIDLADGRRFVCDFSANLHDQFSLANVCGISGASTVPALSSAVINALTAQWQKIDAIDLCIAPAQTAPRGLATMAAVLSYCGQPIKVWQNEQWQTLYGWRQPQRVEFARMKSRLGSLCDIPDLELFPQHYHGVRDVMFRAALELQISQRVFALLAQLRQRGIIAHPELWAKLMLRVAKWFDRFGSSLGGMVVNVAGVNADGHQTKKSWHIAADHDHGPEIPCMAAILLARKLAHGELHLNGAYTAMNLLRLEEFSAEFNKWGMVTDQFESVNDV